MKNRLWPVKLRLLVLGIVVVAALLVLDAFATFATMNEDCGYDASFWCSEFARSATGFSFAFLAIAFLMLVVFALLEVGFRLLSRGRSSRPRRPKH